jgi:hypothetical protein
MAGISTRELIERAPDPIDAVAVVVRQPRQILSARPLSEQTFAPAAIERLIGPDTRPGYEQLPVQLRQRFQARSLIARIAACLHEFAAGSFHATPASDGSAPSRAFSSAVGSRSFTARPQPPSHT